MSHTEAQQELFSAPHVEVTKVTRKKTSTARPTWTKYSPVNPVKCDDCMLVLYLAKGNGPASRQARFKRKQGNDYLLLCHGHADVRRAEDEVDFPSLKPATKKRS